MNWAYWWCTGLLLITLMAWHFDKQNRNWHSLEATILFVAMLFLGQQRVIIHVAPSSLQQLCPKGEKTLLSYDY